MSDGLKKQLEEFKAAKERLEIVKNRDENQELALFLAEGYIKIWEELILKAEQEADK